MRPRLWRRAGEELHRVPHFWLTPNAHAFRRSEFSVAALSPRPLGGSPHTPHSEGMS